MMRASRVSHDKDKQGLNLHNHAFIHLFYMELSLVPHRAFKRFQGDKTEADINTHLIYIYMQLKLHCPGYHNNSTTYMSLSEVYRSIDCYSNHVTSVLEAVFSCHDNCIIHFQLPFFHFYY